MRGFGKVEGMKQQMSFAQSEYAGKKKRACQPIEGRLAE